MGKKIFAACVLSIFVISLVHYINAPTPARMAFEGIESERSPVISIEGLLFWNYSDERINWKVSAQNAVFISPNQLELNGRVRYESPSETRYQSLSCDKALFNFDSDGLLAIKNEAQIRDILAEDNVRLQDGEYTVLTKSARYNFKDSMITSADPVEVQSVAQKFVGENGFVYDINRGSLTMDGEVRGEIVR